MISRNLTHAVQRATYLACLTDAQANSEQVRSATTPADMVLATEFYLSDDGLSGFALNGAELVGVFSLVKGRGDKLVSEAVFYGAEFLDCFDGYLVGFYERNGFVPVLRVPNWTPGGPDVVIMQHAAALATNNPMVEA